MEKNNSVFDESLPVNIIRPVVNSDFKRKSHPCRLDLGPISVYQDGETVTGDEKLSKMSPRLKGHYPELDQLMSPSQTFQEKFVEIASPDGGNEKFIYLQNNDELQLRALVISMARRIVIPVPVAVLAQDCNCLYDLHCDNGIEVNPESKAIVDLLDVIMGLLANPSLDGTSSEGIDLCYIGQKSRSEFLGLKTTVAGKIVKTLEKAKKIESVKEVEKDDKAQDSNNETTANESSTNQSGKLLNSVNDFLESTLSSKKRDLSESTTEETTNKTKKRKRITKSSYLADKDVFGVARLVNAEPDVSHNEAVKNPNPDKNSESELYGYKQINKELDIDFCGDIRQEFLESMLGEPYKILGDAEKQTSFKIYNKNTEKTYTFERFKVITQYRRDTNGFSNENKDYVYPESHCFAFEPPQCILIEILLIDPRIKLIEGIHNLISLNRFLEAKDMSIRKTKSYIKNSDKNIQIASINSFDPRRSSKFATLKSWEEWAILLSKVTMNSEIEDSLSQLADYHGLSYAGSLLDPERVLEPSELFGKHYNYELLYTRRGLTSLDIASRGLWNNNDFKKFIVNEYNADFGGDYSSIVKPKLRSGKNYYRVRFYEHVPGDIKYGAKNDPIIPNTSEETDEQESEEVKSNALLLDKRLRRAKLFVYSYSHQVFDIDFKYISSFRFLSLLFFHKMKRYIVDRQIHPSRQIPFPVQNISYLNYLDQRLQLADQWKKTPNRFIVSNKPHSMDVIYRRYYEGNIKDLRFGCGALKTIHGNSRNVKYDHIFPDAFDCLRGNNDDLPGPLRNICAYLEESKPVVFPDFYKRFKFGYFKNLTPYGNYIANFISKYVNGPVCNFTRNHYLIVLVQIMQAQQMRMFLGFQPTYMFYGEPGSGKSNNISCMAMYSISGTIENVTSQSTQSNSTHTSHDNKFLNYDDMDKNLAMFDTTGLSGQKREERTTGMTTREVNNINHETGLRELIKVTTTFRNVETCLTNKSVVHLSLAFQSRVLAYHVFRDSQNDSSLVRLRNIDSKYEDEFKTIVRGFQIFSGFLGFLLSCGAMSYKVTEKGLVGSVLYRHFVSPIQPVFDGKIQRDDRDQNDKFHLLLYGVTVQRLYASICSGCFADDEDLRPESPLSMEMFKKIDKYNLLCATEEDAMVAMSYMHNCLPSSAHVSIIEWFGQKAIAVGYRPGVFPKSSTATCYRRRHVQSTYTHFGGNAEASNVLYDYDYIDINVEIKIEKIFIKGESEWVNAKARKLALVIRSEFYFIEEFELIKACDDYLNSDVEVQKSLVSINGILEYTTNRSSLIKMKPFYLERIQNNDQFTVERVFVSRYWLDSFFTKDSHFANDKSKNLQSFKSNPLENSFRVNQYKIARKRDILLPGMPCDKPSVLNKERETFPQIFKSIEIIGSVSNSVLSNKSKTLIKLTGMLENTLDVNSVLHTSNFNNTPRLKELLVPMVEEAENPSAINSLVVYQGKMAYEDFSMLNFLRKSYTEWMSYDEINELEKKDNLEMKKKYIDSILMKKIVHYLPSGQDKSFDLERHKDNLESKNYPDDEILEIGVMRENEKNPRKTTEEYWDILL